MTAMLPHFVLHHIALLNFGRFHLANEDTLIVPKTGLFVWDLAVIRQIHHLHLHKRSTFKQLSA